MRGWKASFLVVFLFVALSGVSQDAATWAKYRDECSSGDPGSCATYAKMIRAVIGGMQFQYEHAAIKGPPPVKIAQLTEKAACFRRRSSALTLCQIAETSPTPAAVASCSAVKESLKHDLSVDACSNPPMEINGQKNFEDDGTVLPFGGTNVHVCLDGGVMTGVDAGHNRFLCTHDIVTGPAFLDKSTNIPIGYNDSTFTIGVQDSWVKTITHVCPDNTVMVGWHRDNNWLVCATTTPVFQRPAGWYVADGPKNGSRANEPNFPETALHVCNIHGGRSVMVGINDDKNVLICKIAN